MAGLPPSSRPPSAARSAAAAEAGGALSAYYDLLDEAYHARRDSSLETPPALARTPPKRPPGSWEGSGRSYAPRSAA